MAPHEDFKPQDGRSRRSGSVLVVLALLVIACVLGYFALREPDRDDRGIGLRMSAPPD